MFEYKGTEKFDIGAGHGEYEYEFYCIHNEEDFWAILNHYGVIYRHFKYFLDGYETTENNTNLSPAVQERMKEHEANLCLTFIDEEYFDKNIGIKKIIVNELTKENIYNTYFFYFYYFFSLNARNFLELGRVYAKIGLHNAAIQYFTQGIKLSPNISSLYTFRGVSYHERQNYEKAIDDFTKAIELNPAKSPSYSLRGLSYFGIGNIENAKADLVKSLELNPHNSKAKECLDEIIKVQENG